MKSNWPFHVFALIASMVWGSTFVSSKVLLNAGMSPAEIMTIRFVIAYIVMLPFSHKFMISKSWKDEFLFVALGITGGSMYFLTENTAVGIASATSTVALIVCSTPVITALINRMIWRSEKLSSRFLTGSLIALVGTALVVFNGIFILDDNPLVIILSLAASLCWAFYSIILRVMEKKYDSFVITRKVFFWGVLTMLPYFIFDDIHLTAQMFTRGDVLFNVIFLALVASLGCFLLWNIVTSKIGIVVSSNYLYFNPVVALITANIVLDEKITVYAVVGCIITIIGVYLCNKKSGKLKV